MFDFDQWCAWVQRESEQSLTAQIAITFSLGKPSRKQGATVAFRSDDKLMQLGFWETGEADFYGVRLSNGLDINGFNRLILTDASFEKTFRECLTAAASD